MFSTNLSTRIPTDSSLSSSHLDKLARENFLIRRKSSKTSASGFVHSFLRAVIDGDSSFADLGQNMDDYQSQSVSRQAIHKRVGTEAASFMEAVSAAVLTENIASSNTFDCAHFSRVLIEDSSQVQLHPANYRHFKAHGNFKGATAAYKVDLCWDHLSGESVSTRCVPALANDKKAGNQFVEDYVTSGDLVLRDMGYYNQEVFRRINELGAFWLS